MEWYPKIEGTRCKKGYRHVKRTKRCVLQKEKEEERYPVYVNITFPDENKIYPELDSSVIHLSNISLSLSYFSFILYINSTL
jgi:hypothetical protein